MADKPNYGFHAKPRFSANDLADYMTADTAGQRNAAIREAKFPRRGQVAPYGGSRRFVGPFLSSNAYDEAALDLQIERHKERHKTEDRPWHKAEEKRNQTALEKFKEALPKIRAKKFTFAPGPHDLTMSLEQVRVNVRLDPLIFWERWSDALRGLRHVFCSFRPFAKKDRGTAQASCGVNPLGAGGSWWEHRPTGEAVPVVRSFRQRDHLCANRDRSIAR